MRLDPRSRQRSVHRLNDWIIRMEREHPVRLRWYIIGLSIATALLGILLTRSYVSW